MEVISPNDLAKELDEKLEDYLRAGVKLIPAIDPVTRTSSRFTIPMERRDRLHEADEVSGDGHCTLWGARCHALSG